jgi:hypothetical protein
MPFGYGYTGDKTAAQIQAAIRNLEKAREARSVVSRATRVEVSDTRSTSRLSFYRKTLEWKNKKTLDSLLGSLKRQIAKEPQPVLVHNQLAAVEARREKIMGISRGARKVERERGNRGWKARR